MKLNKFSIFIQFFYFSVAFKFINGYRTEMRKYYYKI